MIQVRPITKTDVPALRECLDMVAKERMWLAFLAAPPLAQCQAFHDGLIADGLPCQVALDDGMIVGWCDIQRDQRQTFRHVGHLGVGLLTSHRGQGLGRRLMEAAMTQAWAAGIKRIELQVVAENARAIRLYRGLGFRDEGRRVAARELDGRFQDMLLMALVNLPEVEHG